MSLFLVIMGVMLIGILILGAGEALIEAWDKRKK